MRPARPRASAQSGAGRGSRISRGRRSSSSRSMLAVSWPKRWALSAARITESITGRSARQSRAVTRWIVPRISHADSPAAGDHRGQLLRVEAVEPAPQPEVRVERVLRLHPDQVLDGAGRPHGPALEEELAPEQRPVQLPPGQHLARHRGEVR